MKKAASVSFAARLRHLRESAGLSVAALAERAGLSRMAVHRYENGRIPSLAVAERLAKAFGKSLRVFEGSL
jgi:transcriptional regulator with XRE-family HTH domain